MAAGTANLREQILTALYGFIVQITGSRHSQSAVPHHKLIVLLVGHLLYTIVRRAVEQIFLEGFRIGDGWGVEHLVDTVGNAFVSTIGIIWIKYAEG